MLECPLPPPYKGEGPPLEVPWKRVLSSPKGEFDPHLEARFPVIFDESGGGRAPLLGTHSNEND